MPMLVTTSMPSKASFWTF